MLEAAAGAWGAVFIGVGLIVSVLGAYLAWTLMAAEVHLDTVFTFADRDCVLLAPDFMNKTTTFSYRPSNHPSGVELHKGEPFTPSAALR